MPNHRPERHSDRQRSLEGTSSQSRDDILPATVGLAVVIRFKNSAKTLPAALAALKAQSVQPDLVLGVDTGSTDESPELLKKAGAKIVRWEAPYHHAKVLNFALARCPAELVLVLSSHTVLQEPDTVARMVEAMRNPEAACVSGKWSEEDSWSDAITWAELRSTCLRLCSIYSNSFGMLRRSLWEATPFDERLVTMEDYAWALEQVHKGFVCYRLKFAFSYQRSACRRDYALAAITFALGRKYGLRVGWLGFRSTVRAICTELLSGRRNRETLCIHRDRVLASLVGRVLLPRSE